MRSHRNVGNHEPERSYNAALLMSLFCSWCPWSPFSADNLLLLYRKQRKMKWLEVMDLDRDILPDLKKSEKMNTEIFQHTRKLALYPENRETLRLCEFFVQKTKKALEEVIIHANFHEALDPRDPSRHSEFIEARELNDSATGPGLLTSTIFSHMMPFEKCEPFKNLKSLRLHRISLRHCADTWCKIVNFTEIEALRVYQCPGADSLFGQLSRAANLPKQLKILEFQHKDNTENEALLALDGFLCLVSGLKDLVIDLERVKTLPAAAGIARHGKTLDMLNVHCSQEGSLLSSSPEDCEELLWDVDDFGKICQACTGLEQLSCAWPPTSLIRSSTDEWKGFETQLANLKELVTLHISTFPNNKPSSQYLPRAVYEQLLQGLAQRSFQVASDAVVNARAEHLESVSNGGEASERVLAQRESKLRLIAFGISDKIYEREDSKNQLLYLRSTCQDAEGKAKIYAAPISWCLRQYVEPRSEVLDFVLHREARPPCREGGGGGGSGLGWADDDE